MNLTYFPFTIELKDTFSLAHGSRKTTPAVIIEIEHEGIIGYGEASLPPYLIEDQKSVIEFLNKVNLSGFNNPTEINSILKYVNNLDEENNAAKASIDIALHDLTGKLMGLPLYKFLSIENKNEIFSSYTISITSNEKIKQMITDASQYEFFKVKLGTENDKEIIELISSMSGKPLYIDVNQGWNDKFYALEMVSWLADKNVKLVEQPLPKEMWEESKWLCERSPVPIIADESVQKIEDLEKVSKSFSGVNIKLMKCGGIHQAKLMFEKAKQLDLKTMLGCMTETSCAVTAASHLASLADWVDLDGAELISNDLFSGMKIVQGKLIIPETPGIGVVKILN